MKFCLRKGGDKKGGDVKTTFCFFEFPALGRKRNKEILNKKEV